MKTKSISLLLVLAILVTIGGVYATWLYAKAPLQEVHGHIGYVGLTDAVLNNTQGTLSVNASGARLEFDQTSATNYQATLLASGNIVVTFTPSEIFKATNPDLEVFEMEYRLVTDNANPTAFTCPDGDGTQKAVFTTFNTTYNGRVLELERKTVDGVVVYQATFPAQDLLDEGLIDIGTFTLNSYEAYTAFSGKIGSFGNVGIEVRAYN